MGVQNVGDAPVEYYSAMKRKEVLARRLELVNVENTLRGGVRHRGPKKR